MSSALSFQWHLCDVFKCAMCCISCSHTLSLLLCVLTLTPTATGAGPETLCGAELVDTLQFVCGERGFYFMLFSELSSHLVTVAMPASKMEGGVTEQDGLGSILGDKPMTELAVVPPMYRRSLVLDNNISDDNGNPKFIIVSDMRLKGHSARGLNPAFTRSLPLITDRSSSHTPSEYSLKIDRRDTDLDMLRCMIGRVYRPCWEV
ncbi:pro-MCH 1-like isoform X1 [Scomber scombrus]|uniref:pro-MCH 1-like isoform X1 n=1 Tax=Scomber scombrus TaxID=13677 RepID=UPI002DD88727|nr:pro-MCH 1-like isoform X1 [Scomber scombrus]